MRNEKEIKCEKLMKHLRIYEFTLKPATFTCSKSTIETLEKGVKYFQR